MPTDNNEFRNLATPAFEFERYYPKVQGQEDRYPSRIGDVNAVAESLLQQETGRVNHEKYIRGTALEKMTMTPSEFMELGAIDMRAFGAPVTQAPPPPDAVRLPTDAKQRKGIPIATGVLDYFPDAIAAVAELSRIGNDQHNPGQPLHWDKTKSTDHADCLLRHLLDRGTLDSDGVRHATKVAWRALALLQTEIESTK